MIKSFLACKILRNDVLHKDTVSIFWFLSVNSIVFFLAVALTSSALIVERMEGLLDRSWVAGVSPSEILFSHVVTQFVVMCGQTALVLIFMILVFDVECEGPVGWVIILTILQGLCGMCFGKAILQDNSRRVYPLKWNSE